MLLYQDQLRTATGGGLTRGVDITTGLWSLHTPLDPTKIKPRGYSNTSGGEPKTRERPQTQQEGNPFDLENRHLTP
jgi:hypothetical protein